MLLNSNPAATLRGTLLNSTPFVQSLAGAAPTITIQLTSSAVGRKVELSVDGGALFFTPQYDASTSAAQIIVTVNAPVTHVRFTGQANDTWSVL